MQQFQLYHLNFKFILYSILVSMDQRSRGFDSAVLTRLANPDLLPRRLLPLKD